MSSWPANHLVRPAVTENRCETICKGNKKTYDVGAHVTCTLIWWCRETMVGHSGIHRGSVLSHSPAPWLTFLEFTHQRIHIPTCKPAPLTSHTTLRCSRAGIRSVTKGVYDRQQPVPDIVPLVLIPGIAQRRNRLLGSGRGRVSPRQRLRQLRVHRRPSDLHQYL